jgi:ubiquinone/menaquinone biosynthesis C-methylase UbiE
MAIKFLNPAYGNSINQKFREKRFNFFTTLLEGIKSDEPIQILDIGGTEIYWERMKFTANNNVIITLLNLETVPAKNNNFISIKGDACDLSSFKDKQFDIVFSNSVIEHLFSIDNQKKMANEAMRVGKFYFVQTPNYFFPIEPHWLFPFFQFLPFKTRVFLTKNFDLGHYKKSVNKEDAIKRVNEVKLLTEKQMKKLFPGGKVYRETFLSLVKSITMYNFQE